MIRSSMTMGVPEQISEVVRQWISIDAAFAKAIQEGASPGQALTRLGIRLCVQERYTESLLILRTAIALAPDDPAGLSNLAVVLERTDQTDEAIRTVECSLALSRAQPDSWIFLGNLRKKRGDLPGAQAAYEAAIPLETTSPLAWQGLGLVKQAQRKYREAIECIATCIRQSAATAPLLSILGQLFHSTGQFEEARDAYAAAVELDGANPVYRRMRRDTQFIWAAIHGNSLEDAIDAYSLDRSAFPGNDGNDTDLEKRLHVTFCLLCAYGHKDAALRLGAKRVALFPASATAAYLLHAVTGDQSIPRSPDAYLVEHFNEYADRFDQHLVDMLGYDIPQKLGAALAGLMPAGARADVLDAGCGTGLCGPWVRGFSASLTGVDLSPGMLDHARRRQVYDHLVCAELTSFLAESPARFGAIVAADVLIYFGELTPLAAAIGKSLRAGGLLAVSTERASLPGHRILSSGRFAHDPDYVRSVFHSEFTECLCEDTTVRLEAELPVAGNIFVFRRR
ncbi:MAG: tetratricopeptide repeat protein [Tepidisphaerales bacterium]